MYSSGHFERQTCDPTTENIIYNAMSYLTDAFNNIYI
jgi:hypothetical protein